MNQESFEGYTLYSGTAEKPKSVIYLHSLTQGFETPFAQYVIEQIVGKGYTVLVFAFDFLKNKTRPSDGFEHELAQLRSAVEYLQDKNPGKISLVGKSLGGTIGLASAVSSTGPELEGIHVLGLPLALGYPPRTELLEGKTTAEFDAGKEYTRLLSQVHVPVQLIQGGSDDLGPIEGCRMLADGFSNVSLDIIPSVDHSFMIAGESAWASCAEKLLLQL